MRVRLLSRKRLMKVPLVYSRVDDGQFRMIDFICLFVYTWYLTLYIMLNCPIVATCMLKPLRVTYRILRLWQGQITRKWRRVIIVNGREYSHDGWFCCSPTLREDNISWRMILLFINLVDWVWATKDILYCFER